MSSKKKINIPVGEPENAEIYNIFANLELTKMCPEKIFEIIFIAETDENTNKIMKRVIHTSREYEEISRMTFITYDEVIDLLQFFSTSDFPLVLQVYLNDIIQETKMEFNETRNIRSRKLAQLIKLKLIETMYQHYLKEVSKMEKRKILEDELHILSVDTKKGGGSKKTEPKELKKAFSISTNMESKSKPKISEKSFMDHSLYEAINLSSLEIENDIVFDDDISNQVWFYIFHGFYDSTVLKELISVYKIPVRAIIKIESNNVPINQENENEHGKLDPFKTFWRDISDNFDGPHRLNVFENTMLMKYDISGDHYKDLFEGLLYVIKSISEIKCKHLNYIRHMKIHEFENVPEMIPLHCLYTYKNLLHHLPTELVDEYIVLSGLLEEIGTRTGSTKVLELGRYDSCERIFGDSETSSACTSPFHFDETFPSSQKHTEKNILTEQMETETFLAHEGDINQIVSKTYRNCGIIIDHLSRNIWKKLFPINLLEKIENNFTDISHSHDVDPSRNAKREEADFPSYFLYLFLFNIFKNGESSEIPRYSEWVENLQTHDQTIFENLLKPTTVNDGSCDDITKTKLYDPSPMEYIWKEQLSSAVLAQELLRAQQAYMYTNLKFSPETDDLLVQLSDNLDEFGSSTEIYEETVLTPVCLRDFCKYVTIEKAEWLEENKPPKYVRKEEIKEQCKGVEKIKNLDVFESYRYLLDSRVVLDEDIRISSSDKGEAREASFESILEQLKNYPTNEKLMDECRKSDINKNVVAYDLGTKYFSIRGAKTIFSSHDNVKITVENSGMIDEEPRCSVNLSCMNNTVSLHTKAVNEYTFHYTLENRTIISFTLRDCQKKPKPNISCQIDNSTKAAGDKNGIETSLFSNSNTKVIAVNSDDFDELYDERFPNDMKSFDPNICTNLKQAIAEGCSIYKVSSKLNYVRKFNDKSEIPLSTIFRRYMHETVPKRPLRPLTKRFVSLNDRTSGLTVMKAVDFRICLPNGLYITCYPSQINDNLTEIKQEYLYRPAVATEEFRLFTRDGTVLIKKTDGSITLLKSNGDTIFFEKPDSEDGSIRHTNLKKCHCKGINDYRKKVNNIMRRNDDESRRYVSRRAFFQTKKGYIISENLAKVLENFKVPYLRRVLLGFDGKRTTLEKNKITQKKVFHTICEQDFFAEEIYFERDDGMQIIFNKFGCQIVRFADGTKISSTVHESKILMDGYVYVSLHFSYEHPHYATVSYNPEDDLKVCLSNDVCVERFANDKIATKIGSDITTVITEKSVEFEKLCRKCNSNYICSFDISPFLDRKIDPSSQFLHAQDSYNKHFYADFKGNCKRNTNFLCGPNNAFGCNHYKNNIYKKLFLIKRASGAQFWSEGMIKLKQNNEPDCEMTKEEFDDKNVEILQFKKFHFESYASRYSNTKVTEEDLCLSKYKKNPKRKLLYTTIRVIKKVVDPKRTNDILFGCMSYLENNEFAGNVFERMKTVLKNSHEKLEVVSSMSNQTGEVKKKEKCKCHKIKRSFSEKISRWQETRDYYKKKIRDPKIPIYFQSQFCGIVE